MVNVAIVGARGYLGRELIRILDAHPDVEGIAPVSLSGPGGTLGHSVPAFAHRDDLPLVGLEDTRVDDADVLFLATAGGQAKAIADRMPQTDRRFLIDLSRDHRLAALTRTADARAPMAVAAGGTAAAAASEGPGWVYGLPDSPLCAATGDRRIANPGCYPTAALLSVLPAVSQGVTAAAPVIVDGKSAVSGAGATPRADLHFAATNENVRAYKVLGHDHGDEIQAAVARAGGDTESRPARPVRFTPHLVPMNRGLLTTSYLPLADGADADDVRAAYAAAYDTSPTVRLVDEPATANVVRTSRAEIAVDVDPDTRLIVARAAIDNLVKGGSGQAVHNMNIALGLEPTRGLPLTGGGP